MTSVWMVYAVAITGIAYLAAAATEHLLWIWRAPRRIAWLIALIVGIAAPVLIPIWRAASHPSPIAAPSALTPARQHLTTAASRSVTLIQGFVAGAPARFVGASAPRQWGPAAESALPAIWLGVSALLLLFAVMSYARLKRQSAAWTEVSIDGTRVVVSPNCGPAVFGILHQHIVIPSWALSLDARARALMLRHEREHLRARDPQFLLVAMFTALIFPWNAALWLIVRRLRVAIELDCDDRVLRGLTDARAYGSLLLAVSARRSHEMPFAVALAERPSMLERRIRAMTAAAPRLRLLVSIPLLLAVTLLSVAAARTPSPRPPSLGRHSAVAVNRDIPATVAARGPQLPRLASPESLPLVSVMWDNAPIETVIEAFAGFSHRRITTAPSVGGVVTATVIDQPWLRALETIMARHGLRVEFRADSSIYISPQRESEPRSKESNQVGQMSRMVSGTVEDAQSKAPIANAYIGVAGVQLIGAPNETWSDDHGHFSLRVPDGEVWLDASAPGFEFTRVTLATTDTIAVFRGRSIGECSTDTANSSDSARRTRGIWTLVGPVLFLFNGQPAQAPCGQSRRIGAVQIKIF